MCMARLWSQPRTMWRDGGCLGCEDHRAIGTNDPPLSFYDRISRETSWLSGNSCPRGVLYLRVESNQIYLNGVTAKSVAGIVRQPTTSSHDKFALPLSPTCWTSLCSAISPEASTNSAGKATNP